MSLPDLITLIGLAFAFATFLGLATREVHRNGLTAIRTIKLQLAIATYVWLAGEAWTTLSSLAYPANSAAYSQSMTGMLIHTVSMGIFALMVVARLPQLIRRAR